MKKPKKKLENMSRQMKMEIQLSASMGYNKSSSKREVYTNRDLP